MAEAVRPAAPTNGEADGETMAGLAPVVGSVNSAKILRENARLQALVSELRTASPSVARLTDLAVWREREAFEEKKDRALVLLRKKDVRIRELGEALAKRNASISRQRVLDEKMAAMARGGDVSGHGGRGRRSVGGGGGGRTAWDDDAGAVVMKRLEKCIEEQADQIEALLEEVTRLRSAERGSNRCNPSLAYSEDFGGDRDVPQRASSGRGYVSARADYPSPPRNNSDTDASPQAQRGPSNGKEWKAPGSAMDDLHSQIARLESVLSSRGVALAQKDEALEKAAVEHREREARLAERVETLERLQEAARRTVLDREERLRAAEAAVAGKADAAASLPPSSSTADAARAAAAAAAAATAAVVGSGAAAGVSTVAAGATADVLTGGDALDRPVAAAAAGRVGGRDRPAELEGGSEEEFSAQEWWMRLAAAERKREERDREPTREAAGGPVAAASRGGGAGGDASGSGAGGGKETRRLHRLLEEQGLEVVALRQRVLKAEIAARARVEERDESRRAAEEMKSRGGGKNLATTTAAASRAEGSPTRPHKLAESAVDLGGMEENIAVLHARGDAREALIVAREAVSELKMRLMRAGGEVELRAQLLEDEKRRSSAALLRAEDLQGKMDRAAVNETLRGVAGGTVSASALIDRFAGTLFRQSRRVKGLEAEVRSMRTRCARLARLARGDSVEAPSARAVAAGGASNAAGRGKEVTNERVDDECWVEAGVQEAAAAMEAGRRRALEEEIASLQKEVLTERQRANTALRDAKDERRLHSLAAAAGSAAVNNVSIQHDISNSSNMKRDDNGGEEAAASLCRQLKLASSEIEALRTHNKDLRDQIQSGWWSWQPSCSSESGIDDGASGATAGGEDGKEIGVWGSGAFEAYAAAEAALRKLVIGGGGGGGGGGSGSGDDTSASIEVDRLSSLLAEREAQVGVLTSSIEALRISPTFLPTNGGGDGGGGGGDMAASTGSAVKGGDAAIGQPASPRLRASRETTRTGTSIASAASLWVQGAGAGGGMTDSSGGVGALNHVGAQGLARRCVALTVGMAAAVARAGKAERLADRLAAETQRREGKIVAAAAAEAALVRRIRALENGAKKTAAALGALRAESVARLREAGEEASKLRNALRDAELGADDACRRLASARAEAHGLAVELQSSRDKHREEIFCLSEAHDAKIKECADRLSLDEDWSLPHPPFSTAIGVRGHKRGRVVAGSGAVIASFGARPPSSSLPIATAIAELSARWRSFVSREIDDDGDAESNRPRRGRRQRLFTRTGATDHSGERRRGGNAAAHSGRSRSRSRCGRRDGGAITISERQLAATTAFLQEAAARLDAECSRAVRRARALEWELAGARRGELDATTALEEAREEVCRLSARAAAAEAAVTAAARRSPAGPPSRLAASTPHADHLAASPTSFYTVPSDHGSGIEFGFDGDRNGTCVVGGGGGGGASTATGRSHYTIAAVSLLEKRFAAAMEDLLASGSARAAALAGEASANARAEIAEATSKGALAAADLLAADLERHKASASDEAAATAAEWRREIREELGRWWRDDLLALHDGVTLDWGSEGAADQTAAACAPAIRKSTINTPTVPAAAAEDRLHTRNHLGVVNDSGYFSPGNGRGGGDDNRPTADARGVTGEEAMAQALIAGRAEQAFLEDRLKVNERRAQKLRGETLRLRVVLERWHQDFVAPALQAAKSKEKPVPVGLGRAAEAPQIRRAAGTKEESVLVDGSGALKRKLLAATAGLLGTREEVTGLRRELASLGALVARLREDEKDARETAGRRVERARETARRRADGDLRDLTERIEEERERFKSQLAAAHAEILRLRVEVSRLEKLRNHEHLQRNETVPRKTCLGGAGGETLGGRVPTHDGARERRAAEEEGEDDGDDVAGGVDEERALRRGVEEEREALRRMCNGLAVDLKEAVEATSEAKREQEAFVQEAAKAKAEAKMAGLARENLEAAVKELGQLLAFARQAAVGATQDGTLRGNGDDRDRPMNAANLSTGWDSSREEARRFARVMVSAKVTEADLLRRLQGAASSESDLRHMLRRRDVQIEELKRGQVNSDWLGRSFGGSGSGSSIPYQQLPFSLRESGSISAVSGAAAAATEGSKRAPAGAAERAAKEVALAANVLRLELELAEATARGEVGDAATRAAERLALRLFPDNGEPVAMAGGSKSWDEAGGARALCPVCGTILERAKGSFSQRVGEHESSGRGALFLVPSAEVERKAARAAASAAENRQAATIAVEDAPRAATTMENATAAEELTNSKSTAAAAPAAAVGDQTVPADDGIRANEEHVTSPSRSSARTRSKQQSISARGEGGAKEKGGRPISSSIVASTGFSDGVRSMEAHLAHLEAVAAHRGPGEIAESNDPEASGESGRIRCATAPGRRGGSHGEEGRPNLSFEVAWADALRELRVQVAHLRHRAEITEEMLEDERAGKDGLNEEVLRLQTELLRQQRSSWQATAALKDRYERGLLEGKQVNNGGDGVSQRGVAAAGGLEAVSSPSEEKGSPDKQRKETAAAEAERMDGNSDASCTDNKNIEQQCGPSSRKAVDERLRATKQELREVRMLHDREAKDVAAELTRVIEAHRARVATLEEKVRRTRRKMGAMGRPKPIARRRKSAGRAGGQGGGGDGGDGDGNFAVFPLSKTPLSADELLNLLTAADEEAFEAKGRAQRVEYELQAKNAEVNALLLLRERGTVTAATTDRTVRNGAAVEEASVGGSDIAGDGAAAALAPSYPAAAAAVAAASTAKNCTGLASVASYARLAFAETEVENLRDRNQASGELVLEAQREAAALRLASHRKTAGHADESRSREKELRRQVSAYKREAERLRSAAAVAAGLACAAGKNGRVVRYGGAGARTAASGEQQEEPTTSRRRDQQLVAAREESERKGRAVLSLRAAKTALGGEVQRLRQEEKDKGEKLARALKDVAVKGNMVHALREKIAALESEIVVLSAARPNATAVTRVVAAVDSDRGAVATTGAGADAGTPVGTPVGTVATTAGPGDAAGKEPLAPPDDVKTATVRELRAERDRLRANMRGWSGSLSKKTAEIRAQVTEIERLEGEAVALRAAVARKEDAYRATKKQLISVREEYERFKESSLRWRADAEVKWRDLKRAGEAAVRRAKDSERSGDAAELELAALKAAFRSFLKTLWDDLRSRPVPAISPVVGAGSEIHPVPGIVPAISSGNRDVDSGSGNGTAQNGPRSYGMREKGSNAVAGFDGESSGLSSTSGISWMEEASESAAAAVPSAGEDVLTGLAKATAAVAAAPAVAEGGVVNGRASGSAGRGSRSPFAELTEAEVSDIMQALSAGEGDGESFLVSTSSSFHDESSVETICRKAAATISASSCPQRHHAVSPEGEQGGVTPAAIQLPSPGHGSSLEKEHFSSDRKTFVEHKSPSIDHTSVQCEDKEAFADRVEMALGGSNPSAALAVMLRSLRASSFSKAVTGSFPGSEVLPPGPLAREETKLSRSWSQRGTPFAGIPTNDEERSMVKRSPLLHGQAPAPSRASRLGIHGTGTFSSKMMLNPLDETPPAGSASNTEAFGGFGGGFGSFDSDALPKLLVEDLAS